MVITLADSHVHKALSYTFIQYFISLYFIITILTLPPEHVGILQFYIYLSTILFKVVFSLLILNFIKIALGLISTNIN